MYSFLHVVAGPLLVQLLLRPVGPPYASASLPRRAPFPQSCAFLRQPSPLLVLRGRWLLELLQPVPLVLLGLPSCQGVIHLRLIATVTRG